jgi:hypothetical protein
VEGVDDQFLGGQTLGDLQVTAKCSRRYEVLILSQSLYDMWDLATWSVKRCLLGWDGVNLVFDVWY